MKLSTLLKGAVFAASFVALASEASAQLPVRTQQLQLLGSTSGNLTQRATATTTSYSVTWPAANVGATAGDRGILLGTATGATATDFSWYTIPTGDNLITGAGTNGQVAFFDGASTITSDPSFLFDAGTANMTLGSATQNGNIILTDGGAGGTNNTTTFGTGTQTSDNTFNFDAPTTGGTYTVPVSTNAAGSATAGYIAISNGDGTFSWVADPTTGLQRGTVNGNVGNYTTTITVVGTPDLTNDVIIVSTSNSASTGNILQVTAVAANAITVSSTAPFDGTDRISWLWIPIP